MNFLEKEVFSVKRVSSCPTDIYKNLCLCKKIILEQNNPTRRKKTTGTNGE